jgi:hypothetical protein
MTAAECNAADFTKENSHMSADYQSISAAAEICAGFVIFRCRPERQNALWYLNASETATRIKHLPGFISGSFHTGIDGATVAEYVQWENYDYLQQALKIPAFSEHVPLAGYMSLGTDVSFYAVYSVHTRNKSESIEISRPGELSCFKVFTVTPTNMDAELAELGAKVEKLLAEVPGVESAALHKGLKADNIGLFLRLGVNAELDTLEAVRQTGLGEGPSESAVSFARLEAVFGKPDHSEKPIYFRLTPTSTEHDP